MKIKIIFSLIVILSDVICSAIMQFRRHLAVMANNKESTQVISVFNYIVINLVNTVYIQEISEIVISSEP